MWVRLEGPGGLLGWAEQALDNSSNNFERGQTDVFFLQVPFDRDCGVPISKVRAARGLIWERSGKAGPWLVVICAPAWASLPAALALQCRPISINNVRKPFGVKATHGGSRSWTVFSEHQRVNAVPYVTCTLRCSSRWSAAPPACWAATGTWTG